MPFLNQQYDENFCKHLTKILDDGVRAKNIFPKSVLGEDVQNPRNIAKYCLPDGWASVLFHLAKQLGRSVDIIILPDGHYSTSPKEVLHILATAKAFLKLID